MVRDQKLTDLFALFKKNIVHLSRLDQPIVSTLLTRYFIFIKNCYESN